MSKPLPGSQPSPQIDCPEATRCGFVGARKGATGAQEDAQTRPPIPKSWLRPALIEPVMARLQKQQGTHTRLDLFGILGRSLFDAENDRYRIVWSRRMITAAGLSEMKKKTGEKQLLLHFRDGEEECKDGRPHMRKIIEGLYAKGGGARESVEDFFYLTLVHEASEIGQRNQRETLSPDIKAEVRAEIEEAKAYFALPPGRRKALRQLYRMLDTTADPRTEVFSRELDCFEAVGEEKLTSISGLLQLINFVLDSPDYVKQAKLYPDERTRLQLARSLFVDVLHDFAGASEFDQWVRDVESSDLSKKLPIKYKCTENSIALSEQAEETLTAAARFLETLNEQGGEPEVLPSRGLKKGVIEGFNNKINELLSVKKQLRIDEVLMIPAPLRRALEDNQLNRHFSYMDDLGIYHSLNLSRLDLRGLDLHSGLDERTEKDRISETNQYKDGRSDLRGAFLFGCDLSGRADFSAAQLDFAIACFSDLTEVIFTGARAIGIVLYGANANEGQFERANMTAADARGMSASFARIQMQETIINGMKIWQSDVPNWQRAYVDIATLETGPEGEEGDVSDLASLKDELDFLDDSFISELKAMDSVEGFKGKENWIELRELDGQLGFLKGRGIVFYSRDEHLEYSD